MCIRDRITDACARIDIHIEAFENLAGLFDHEFFVGLDATAKLLAQEKVFIDLEIRKQVELLINHANTGFLGRLRGKACLLYTSKYEKVIAINCASVGIREITSPTACSKACQVSSMCSSTWFGAG